jgi:hypothetical protein
MKSKQRNILLLVLLNATLFILFMYQSRGIEEKVKFVGENETLAEFSEKDAKDLDLHEIITIEEMVGHVVDGDDLVESNEALANPSQNIPNLNQTIVIQSQTINCNCAGNLSRREICKNGNITKLESFSNEEAAEFYDQMMKNIQKPEKAEFLESSDQVQLEIVLTEMKDSESKWLLPAIYNIVNVYAKENVAFTIAHHAFHTPVLSPLKDDFKNLRLIELAQGPFTI